MEFGTTTGRPRRCGWLDIVALKYCCQINGFSSLNLTKLDVLTGLKEIKLGTSYYTDDGNTVQSFPADLDLLEQIKVRIETVYPVLLSCVSWYFFIYNKIKEVAGMALNLGLVSLDNISCGLWLCRSNMRPYLDGRKTFPQYETTVISQKLLVAMWRG